MWATLRAGSSRVTRRDGTERDQGVNWDRVAVIRRRVNVATCADVALAQPEQRQKQIYLKMSKSSHGLDVDSHPLMNAVQQAV